MKFTIRSQAHNFYADILRDAEKDGSVKQVMAEIGRKDLFFLLVRLCNRIDIDNDWLFDRCVEVQNNPDNMLDLWAREHYKSTIITFGKTIQDIVTNPDVTVGIFSHTRPIAKGFLRQIKREFEDNQLLKEIYSDILWSDPRKESPSWSEDNGIIVKRATNPKEATVEAWGLVDGQPTSKHFSIVVYDDVVTRESVTNPEQIKKTTDALALSYNLGVNGGRRRFIGTRYHYNDTYKTILDRNTATPRIYPATEDGSSAGRPVFLTGDALAQKRRDMGPYVFACQMLQDPRADDAQGFSADWLKYWKPGNINGLNVYIVCDPAQEKKKTNDYTVFMVIGLGPDENYYLIDMIRDRLNLSERTDVLFNLHRKYRPIATGYEKYGKDSDIQHIEYVQGIQNYRFDIVPLGGPTPKNDRIRRLVPVFAAGRWYIPKELWYVDYESRRTDLINSFINDEYLAFPVALHDDMLDCAARIVDPDLEAKFPRVEYYDADILPEEEPDY